MRTCLAAIFVFCTFAMNWAALAAEKVTSFTLENGLEVIVIEDHRAPIVVHMIWYRVGAADEPPGKSGIAHFLEHLMFKGTDKRASGEFSRIVEANGGTDNAFTAHDYTGYWQRIASDRLDLVMEMEADRMRSLNFPDDEFETERSVILEERAQRTDARVGAQFGEQRAAALYMNHPYGIPIIGWKHEIEALTRGDVYSFYREFYAPNNAFVIVAGDVEPETVREFAERHYGPIEPTPGLKGRQRPTEPPHRVERRLTFSDPRVSQPYVVRTYLARERDSGDQRAAAAQLLLAELLGGSSVNSIFNQELMIKNEIAVYTTASYRPTSLDVTTFSILVMPTDAIAPEAAEQAMDDVVAAFLESDVDPGHLARIQARIRAESIYEQDNVTDLALKYGQALTAGLELEDVEAWPDVIGSITGEEIIEVARTVFDRDQSVTGWLMREESE